MYRKLFCFHCPAHLGRSGTSVLGAFLCRWTYDISGIIRIDSSLVSGLEGFFDQFILSGVKCQDCNTSARLKGIRKFFHKFIEHFKFTVYIDTKCLENTLAGLADGILLFFFRKEKKRLLYDLTQFRSCLLYTSDAADE